MKHDEEHPLADDVASRVDEARLARQWSAVSGGLAARPRQRFFFAALAPAAVVGLATIAVLIAKPWHTTPTDTATRATTPDALVLPDGSHLTLSNGAET